MFYLLFAMFVLGFYKKKVSFGFSLEHPQGVGIVGTVGIVGIEFCRPEPQPTTPSVLVDI